jgi:PAS domain S-box-containing protein
VLENQGLLAIAFFEATTFIILLVLFLLFRQDHRSSYFRLWVSGWLFLTLSSFFELALILRESPAVWHAMILFRVAAALIFLMSVVRYADRATNRNWSLWPLAGVILAAVYYVEHIAAQAYGFVHWETSTVQSIILLCTGWLLWRVASAHRGHGAALLAGGFFLTGLHTIDQPLWPRDTFFLLRVAFDHLLFAATGVAMVVLVLERARARSEELNDKLRRLTLLTAASTQAHSVREMLEQVLGHLIQSMDATHGTVHLIEGEGNNAAFVVRASAGFAQDYLARHARLPITDVGMNRVLKEESLFLRLEEEQDPVGRQRLMENGLKEVVALKLPGKDRALGVITVASKHAIRFQPDEASYLVNIANLVGLTLQNVRLFEQVATAQQQWMYTFDSIGDPILVHDRESRILRSNQRFGHLLGRDSIALVGRAVSEILPRKDIPYERCPYCEGIVGEGDDPDPWLQGYFLASNSTFTDSQGRQLGTVHVLKDITDRKRAEEKYRTLVSNVQEGVFISTPAGRFLDFNHALMRMLGYENREELLSIDLSSIYVTSADRERLKKLLQEHGSVADFEFEIRRRDGEVRTMMESSIAVLDAAGNVTAFQGFLLDITDRIRAEQEVRRRNRELLVLNSIAQTLMESMDLSDSLHRTLRQMAELFKLDASSLYLFDEQTFMLRRVAVVGYRSEFARQFPVTAIQADLLAHIKAVHATFLSAQGLPLPAVFREVQQKEGLQASFIVILWSKDRVLGALAVGTRTAREFSAADINLLTAVSSQISNAIDRNLLHEETRQAYDNLRRTQEQLLQSEKMSAVGQLISGVAHELNNPLTAILGYSQLLTTSGEIGAQGLEYTDKLYKQAQRTHRIVQNLLSFARQHKPERVPVQLNQILEDTLALRDYDLRMKNIRVHRELAAGLPLTAADPHQLQQVFLNLVNNAVDAVLENAQQGELWVRSAVRGDRLAVEFADNGPGVREPSRVFDPFYTTKPVGKGTGLGLSICYGIITEHGGTISVRNLHPHGASFTIDLPFQVPLSADSRAEGAARPPRKAQILLVDSDGSVLEAVGAILREHNHMVWTASTLKQAQVALAQRNFDVLIADMHVSGSTDQTDQAGLAQWVAAHQPVLLSRSIWMRASALPAPEGEPRRDLQILRKPFSAGDLLTAVEAALNSIHPAPVER